MRLSIVECDSQHVDLWTFSFSIWIRSASGRVPFTFLPRLHGHVSNNAAFFAQVHAVFNDVVSRSCSEFLKITLQSSAPIFHQGLHRCTYSQLWCVYWRFSVSLCFCFTRAAVDLLHFSGCLLLCMHRFHWLFGGVLCISNATTISMYCTFIRRSVLFFDG